MNTTFFTPLEFFIYGRLEPEFQKKEFDFEFMKKKVALITGYPLEVIFSKSRLKELVCIRRLMCVYLLQNGYNPTDSGLMMGKDHSYAFYCEKQYANMKDTNDALQKKYCMRFKEIGYELE